MPEGASGYLPVKSNIRAMTLLVLGVFALTLLACSDKDDSPTATPGPTQPPVEAFSVNRGAVVELLELRPTTIEELVAGPDVIFVGTVASMIAEREIGPYGADGLPDAASGPIVSVTDYAVSVERILKSDGFVSGFGIITLRMSGHPAPETGFALSIAAVLPEVGEKLLFLLDRNPDGTYSAGDEGLLIVDGESVKFHDGTIFGEGTDVELLLAQIEALGR